VILRGYQTDAISAIERSWTLHRRALLVMATGCGKTVVFARLVADRASLGRAMVIAHRQELIDQAARKIEALGVTTAVEMADRRSVEDGFSRARCVVASVQTLSTGRIDRFDPADFATLIIDEAHHATSESYKRVTEWAGRNPSMRILGVTATPDRLDGRGLAEVFDVCAYKYDIAEAVRDGYLVDVRQDVVHVEGLDFSKVRTQGGDLVVSDLDQIVRSEESLHGIAAPASKLIGSRPAIVFAVTVEHATQLAEVMSRYTGAKIQVVHGGTPRKTRERHITDYCTGDVQVLVNVGVFTEGFDAPATAAVVMARPTKSRALYAQMVGRGTRPLPGIIDHLTTATERRNAIACSPKPDVLVVDMVGNAGRHKLISATDILGQDRSDEIVERAKRIIEQNDDMLVGDALDAAEAEIEREAEEQRKLLELRKRKHIVADVDFRTVAVKPFSDYDRWRFVRVAHDTGTAPTQGQTEYLRQLGVDPRGMTKFTARRCIDELVAARTEGKVIPSELNRMRLEHRDSELTLAEAQAIKDRGRAANRIRVASMFAAKRGGA